MDNIMEEQIDDAAAQWFARTRSGALSAREKNAFEAWLGERIEHRIAYEDMLGAWDLAQHSAGHEAIRAMREAALAAGPSRRVPLWSRKWAAAAALAMVSFAVAAVILVRTVHVGDARTYTTAVGERSTVALDDGSTLVLNTASRVRVDFGPHQRLVTLLSGQALFDVAKDAGRPFVVFAGNRRIEAVGTVFDVRLDPRAVRVTLVEGRVRVDAIAVSGTQQSIDPQQSVNPQPHPVQLEPGQELVATAEAAQPDTVHDTDVGQTTSWREGRVVFDGEPLRAVIAEMNRYSERKIRLRDESLGELRVSGTFRTGNPANFAHALQEYFPIKVTNAGADLELLHK